MISSTRRSLVPAQTSVSLLPLALARVPGSCRSTSTAHVHGLGRRAVPGFALRALLSIIGGAKVATVLLVMGAPILDVAWQIVRRLREGHNPMAGDAGACFPADRPRHPAAGNRARLLRLPPQPSGFSAAAALGAVQTRR
jgi:hypothetical protein